MIKKVLLTLGLLVIGLINFSEGYNYGLVGGMYNISQTETAVLNKGSFLSRYGGVARDFFTAGVGQYLFRVSDAYSSYGRVYVRYYRYPSSSWHQGFLQSFLICDNFDSSITSAPGNCSTYQWDTGNEFLLGILNGIDSSQYRYYDAYGGDRLSSAWIRFCMSSNVGNSICFYSAQSNITNGQNFGDYSSVPLEYVGVSPAVGGGSGGEGDGGPGENGDTFLSNSDITSYYESTYGFNYNMCFVGTWDFNQSEGTFKQGNGDHIFSYFNWFFDLGTGVNATGYKLSDVGKFIDEMYANYDIYFNYGNRYANGNIAYIYKFDIDTHILDRVETGYNNPFEENTYVYEFYPKILHYNTDYWRIYYYGGELANYCYYKLNFNNESQEEVYGNLENDISKEQLSNISTWKLNKYNFNYTLSGNKIEVSEDWSGSPLDYFAVNSSSGYQNFDAGTFFKDSFNRFKNVFGTLSPGDFGLGYLPSYIIGFLLAIILFRFLSH